MVKRTQNMRSRIGVEWFAFWRLAWQAVLAAFGFSAMPLKHRHFFTREGKLRVRYIAFVMVGFLGFVSSFQAPEGNFALDPSEAPVLATQVDDWQNQELMPPPQLQAQNEFEGDALAVADGSPRTPTRKPIAVQPNAWTRNILVRTGDTLPSLLATAGMDDKDVGKALDALSDHISTKDLVAGRTMRVGMVRGAQGAGAVDTVEFTESGLESVLLTRQPNGAFKAEQKVKQLKREIRAVKVTIRSALYNDLNKAGVPHDMIISMIKAYSYSVDFARDIWDGDKVELLYDVDRTDDGSFVKGNDLLMARLILRGRLHEIVRFNVKGSSSDFYDGKGKTIKRAFLQTPIDGARITSGFGMRRHPIQGYTKMHKGVDFGAPTGTPIFAAGDGVIARAGWVSGYGNYVKITHNGTYSTAYAHMSRFAKGSRTGARVKQGQVIGYVGTTGNSTGPHLHFELVKGGTQINPRSVANISLSNGMGGAELKRFQATRAGFVKKFETLLGEKITPGKLVETVTEKPEPVVKKATKAKAKSKPKKKKN